MTNITGSAITIIGSGAQAQDDGLTIARVRGYLEMHLTAATAINDGFVGAFALGIASENAFAAGAASVMDPVNDLDWDGWFYHRFISLHGLLTTAAGLVRLAFEVDTKAMRKVAEGDTVYAVLQTTETGTATMDVFFDSRLLALLP